jgi:hypothetical protein
MRRLISSLVNLLSSSRSIPPSMLNPQNTRHYPFFWSYFVKAPVDRERGWGYNPSGKASIGGAYEA